MLIFEGEIFRPAAHNLNKRCIYTYLHLVWAENLSSLPRRHQPRSILSNVSDFPIAALPLVPSQDLASSSYSHRQCSGWECQEKASACRTIQTNWKCPLQVGSKNTTVKENWFCLGTLLVGSILPTRQGVRELRGLCKGNVSLWPPWKQDQSAIQQDSDQTLLVCFGKSPQRSLPCDWDPASVIPLLVSASYCLCCFHPSSPVHGILGFNVLFFNLNIAPLQPFCLSTTTLAAFNRSCMKLGLVCILINFGDLCF